MMVVNGSLRYLRKVEFWFTLSQFHKVRDAAAAAVAASSGGNE